MTTVVGCNGNGPNKTHKFQAGYLARELQQRRVMTIKTPPG